MPSRVRKTGPDIPAPPPDATDENTPETATILPPDQQMERPPPSGGGATHDGPLVVAFGGVGRWDHGEVLGPDEIAQIEPIRLQELLEMGALVAPRPEPEPGRPVPAEDAVWLEPPPLPAATQGSSSGGAAGTPVAG